MHFFALPTTGQVLSIVFAFLLSAPIGVERELRHKDAGLRTHVLVALGSCLFTLVSIGGFPTLGSGVEWDASRIAAQIVSGIGFIGAGVIWFNHDAIRGLTTASAIWLAAAIGMACGAQMFFPALLIVLAYFLLVLVCAPMFYKITRSGDQIVEVSYEDGQGVLRNVLLEVSKHGFESKVLSFRQSKYQETRSIIVTLQLKGTHNMDPLMASLSSFDGVIEARIVDNGEA